MMKNENSRQPYFYPEYIVNALNRIITLSTHEGYPLLSRGTEIINVLFNDDYPITEQVYGLVWRWVNLMADAKNEDWLRQYWSTASQYYSFKLSNTDNEESKSRFVEFHTMVGVMLLYKECYIALKHALFFTNSFPARYPLIQSTFISIFSSYNTLAAKNQNMYLIQYPMSKIFEGTGDENRTEGLLLKYCALLMIRLSSVNDYNITYSNPIELPKVGNTIGENEQILRTIEVIKNKIESINHDVVNLLGFDNSGKETAKNLLENYAGECKNRIEEIKANQNIDSNKISGIKNKLIAEVKNIKLGLPKSGNCNTENHSYCASQQVMLDEYQVLSGYDYISSNMEEFLINRLRNDIFKSYSLQFLLHSACFSSAMPYRNMGQALKYLSLNKNFAIIAMGVNESFYDETDGFSRDDKGKIKYGDCSVYQLPSTETSIVIMKAESLPFFKLVDDGEGKDADETQIDKKTGLYSNIDTIDAKQRLLKVSMKYNVCVPTENFKYVRLRISYSLTSDPVLLSRIKSISNYIV